MTRSITGHTTSQMMQAYVKFNQSAKQKFMDKLDGTDTSEVKEKETSTVYDLVESANDIKMLRKMLSTPDTEKYLKKIEKDPMLAVFLWNTQTVLGAAPYIDRLPSDYLGQVCYLMATTRQYIEGL